MDYLTTKKCAVNQNIGCISYYAAFFFVFSLFDITRNSEEGGAGGSPSPPPPTFFRGKKLNIFFVS